RRNVARIHPVTHKHRSGTPLCNCLDFMNEWRKPAIKPNNQHGVRILECFYQTIQFRLRQSRRLLEEDRLAMGCRAGGEHSMQVMPAGDDDEVEFRILEKLIR